MEFLNKIIKGEKKLWSTKLFTDLCQLEMEYAYKKAGNKSNSIIDSAHIQIKKEPENKYDPNAVAIYCYNVKIGYFYQDARDEYLELKHLENPYLRVYYYNEKFGAEFNVTHRIK